MSISESIFVGVLSGVITSVLLYILLSVTQKIILPWYQSLIYKGISIEGEWCCLKISPTQDAYYTINQKASNLGGTATIVDHDAQTQFDTIRTFTLKGDISDRFVKFSMKHTDHNRLGSSVYLLQVGGDGTELKGEECWYAIDSSQIKSKSTTLTRKNKTLKSVKKTA